MWHIALLIPPFSTFVWALIKMKGFEVRIRRQLLSYVAIAALTYFTIQDIVNQMGVYPFVGAKLLHDLAACTIVPALHLLICYSMGITHGLKYFKMSMLLLVLMLPDIIYSISLMPDWQQMQRSDMFNYLHLSFAEHHSLTLQMYSIIIICQIGIELQRITVLRKIFDVRRLYLARGAKSLIYLFVVVCVWIFLTVIPSHEIYAHTVYGTVMMVGYSIIATCFCLGFTLFFNYNVVLDSENNPVEIGNDNDSALAEDIQLLIERDEVYRNSNLRIDDLAAMLSTNRTYVARAFRLKFGASFTEVMNTYRVEHAKRLMVSDPKKRMEEIALESGFSSSNFFGRVFKAAEGITPSTWRSEVRNGRIPVTTGKLPRPDKPAAPAAPVRGFVAPSKGMTTEEMLGIASAEDKKVGGEYNSQKTNKKADVPSEAQEIAPPEKVNVK